MALLEELTQLQTARRHHGGIRCRIATVLDAMSADEAAALAHLIDETDVYATQVAGTLERHGFQVNSGQVAHHRRRLRLGGCSCPRPDEAA